MNILLALKERKYAEAVERTLSDLAMGLDISIRDGQTAGSDGSLSEDAVIITDIEDIALAYPSKSLYMRDKDTGVSDMVPQEIKSLDIYATADVMLNYIEDIYGVKRQGASSQGEDIRKGLHIAFESVSGGTGLTSVAVTLARLISTKLRKKVLYISLHGDDNIRPYMENETERERTTEELLYRISEKEVCSLGHYITRDVYDVDYISLNGYYGLLGEVLRLARGYDVVVSDMGSYGDVLGCCSLRKKGYSDSIYPGVDMHVTLFDRKSMRYPYFMKKYEVAEVGDIEGKDCDHKREGTEKSTDVNFKYGDYIVINHADRNAREGNTMYIAEDESAFSGKNDRIRINNASIFCVGVGLLLESIYEKCQVHDEN